jgi:hypothetical protein
VVQLEALAADASGALDTFDAAWSFCAASRPLAEAGPVAASCLEGTSSVPLGEGIAGEAALPDDGCSLFGPNPPPPAEGEIGGRPVDPDITGGFYQPIPAIQDGVPLIVAAARLRCGLANVSQESYIEWNRRYHSNQNPSIASMVLRRADGSEAEIPPDPRDGSRPAGTPVVATGEAVTLELAWPSCPVDDVCGDGVCSAGEDAEVCPEDCTEPVGCGGAESYVVYASGTQSLETRREALSAAWFTTGGALQEARSGRAGDDLETALSNGWTAPEAPGEVWLAAVLRDERGGVAFQGYWLQVGP